MKKSGLDLKIDLCRFRRKSKKLGAFSSFQFAVFNPNPNPNPNMTRFEILQRFFYRSTLLPSKFQKKQVEEGRRKTDACDNMMLFR